MLHILPLLAKRVPDPPGMLVVTGAVTTFGNSRAAVVARFLGSPAHLFPGAVPGNAGVTLDYSNATVWCGPSATDATEARSRAVQSASVVLTGPEAASVTEYARTLHPDLIRRWHGGRPPLPLLTVADLPKEVNSSALPSSDPRAVGVAGGPITGEPRKKEKKVVEQWLVLCLLGLVGGALVCPANVSVSCQWGRVGLEAVTHCLQVGLHLGHFSFVVRWKWLSVRWRSYPGIRATVLLLLSKSSSVSSQARLDVCSRRARTRCGLLLLAVP
jgi:hypothetical protein